MKNLVLCLAACAALSMSSVKADDEAKEFTGEGACSACAFKQGGCASALKVGDKVYVLKCSEKADDATKAAVKNLNGASKTVTLTVKGVAKEEGGKSVIIVDSAKASADVKKGG